MLELIKSIFVGEKSHTERTDIISERLKEEEKRVEQKNETAEPSSKASMKLSLSSSMGAIISDTYIKYLEKEVEELPPVKDGDVKLAGLYAVDQKGDLEVKFYICNGSNQSLKLEEVPLAIIDSKGNVIAKQSFDFSEEGEIPPYSARPCQVYFDEGCLEEFNNRDWKLIFDIHKPKIEFESIELEALPNNLEEQQRVALQNWVNKLPSLVENELNMSVFNVVRTVDEGLVVSIVIRNGFNKKINIEKLPLTIKDANDKDVAKGYFVMDNLIINPLKARIWSFKFIKENIIDNDMNLSKCTICI